MLNCLALRLLPKGVAWIPVCFLVLANSPVALGLSNPTFEEKCQDDGVIVCHKFSDQASVDELYVQAYAKKPAQYDPIFEAGKLILPRQAASNMGGTFLVNHPAFRQNEQGNDQYWMQYRVRLPQEFLDNFPGFKISVVYYKSSCGANEVAQTGGLWVRFYETCGANGIYETNPDGQQNQWDFQPGGDTTCYRTGSHPTEDCFEFVGDVWTTFTVHYDLTARMAHVWAQHEGEDPIKIIEHRLTTTVAIGSVFFGPYVNSRKETDIHPEMAVWFQDIIISKNPIEIGSNVSPFPENNARPVIQHPGDQHGREGQRLTFTFSATDADGDPLVFSGDTSSLPGSAAVATSADGLSGTFSWIPGYDAAGTYEITLNASDKKDDPVYVPVRVIVEDAASQETPDELAARWRLDDTAGSQALDSSGHGATGTLMSMGDDARIPGVSGGALYFDGSSAHVRVSPNDALDIEGDISASLWIKVAKGLGGVLLHKDLHYTLRLKTSGALTWSDSSSWSYSAFGDHGQVPNDRWAHVAVVRSGATVSIYIDGVKVANREIGGGLTKQSSLLHLGCYANRAGGSACAGQYFTGSLDDVRIYTYALSESEIKDLLADGGAEPPAAPDVPAPAPSPAPTPTPTPEPNVAPVARSAVYETRQGLQHQVVLRATDQDGDALTYAIQTLPSHGDLQGTPPNLRYLPHATYTGSDSFTYRANDGQSDSNLGTVSIQVRGSDEFLILASSDEFTLGTDCVEPLENGEHCMVEASLTPFSAGNVTAELSILTPEGDTHVISLSGTGDSTCADGACMSCDADTPQSSAVVTAATGGSFAGVSSSGIPGVRQAPSWVQSLPVAQWHPISKNYIKDVDSAVAFGYRANGAPWSSVEGLSGITYDWNGGALASNYGDAGALLVWGGGHGGYGGSDLYGFDLSELVWKRLSNPYGSAPGSVSPLSVADETGSFPDGSPIPFHTWDLVEYQPTKNKFIVMSGRAKVSATQHIPLIAHLLNLDHMTADNYEHTATSSPWERSRLFEESIALGGTSHQGGTCYDRNRDYIWIVDRPGSGGRDTSTGFGNLFMSYDPNVEHADGTVGTITSHGYGPGSGFGSMRAACDPVKDLLVLTSFGVKDPSYVFYKDLRNPSAKEKRFELVGAERPTNLGKQHGWEYSDVRNAFIYYDDANPKEVWEFRIEDDPSGQRNYRVASWHKLSTGAGIQPDSNINDVFSRFRIAKFNLGGKLVEVAVMVNHIGEEAGKGDVYAFRIPGERSLDSSGSNSAPVANDITLTTAPGLWSPVTLSGFDVDGNPLSYDVDTTPAHGRLTGTPPALEYSPNADYAGIDSFTYHVHDGKLASTTATVTVRVVEPSDEEPVLSGFIDSDRYSISPASISFGQVSTTGCPVAQIRVEKKDVDPLDFNRDGVVDRWDIRFFLQNRRDAAFRDALDVNGDGRVASTDLRMWFKHLRSRRR